LFFTHYVVCKGACVDSTRAEFASKLTLPPTSSSGTCGKVQVTVLHDLKNSKLGSGGFITER
jgi:hypothetical protein